MTAKKILVVDNDRLILEFMEELLTNKGHEVVKAEDSLVALDALKTYKPDFIFLDLVMPHIDGARLCRIIRRILGQKGVYIVILSATAAESREDLAQLGADAVIAKGKLTDMAQNIQTLLSKPEIGDPGKALGVEALHPRRVTEELLDINKHFEIILEGMSEGILELDSNERIIYVNNAAASMSETAEEDLLGSRLSELFRKQDRPRLQEILQESLQHGKRKSEDSPMKLKNTMVTLDIFSPHDEGQARAIVILNDVTEKKRIEMELIRAQKMEAIGTLAAGIAHDFNNILAVILGHTELAGIQLEQGLSPKVSLEEVLKACARAKDLVGNILAFGRKGVQGKKPVRLEPVVKETIKLLKASLPKNIELRQEIMRNTGTVHANPSQVQQVLMNLCSNAAQAMSPGGGIVEVALENVTLDTADVNEQAHLKLGSYVKMTVRDNGHGMSSETMEQIFDPFFTTKDTGSGTGLGLAVVHGIVREHGGTTLVTSDPGKGSVFEIFFPEVEVEPENVLDPESSIVGGGERILFVDDEVALAKLGKRILETLGYEVVSETNSEEALRKFKADPENFDLVLTDLSMPNMPGDRFTQELISLRPDIPVILCSGYGNRISEQRTEEIGLKYFLEKPWSKRDLAEIVRKALAAARKP